MNRAVTGLAAALALAMAGCSTHVSRDISADGQAGQLLFPEPDSALVREGTFPGVDVLSQVGKGMNKDQLYALLGRPHFREGFARVREWDYLFHFRQGDELRTCQYKLIFDENYQVGSIHWLPEDCASVLERPAVAAAPTSSPMVTGEPANMLQAHVQFAFSRSDSTDLVADGRARIAEIAARLKAAKAVEWVEVLGYADRIGNASGNIALSQARAETVRELLIAEGVPQARIRSIGMGSLRSQSNCATGGARHALQQCLAPDRRVEIRASVLEP